MTQTETKRQRCKYYVFSLQSTLTALHTVVGWGLQGHYIKADAQKPPQHSKIVIIRRRKDIQAQGLCRYCYTDV